MTWQAVRAHLDNQATNTARTYRAALRIWCEFLKVEEMSVEGAKAIIEATPLDAMRWVEALRKRKGQAPRFGGHSRAAAATISKRVAAMRSIYNALLDAQVVGDNPFNIRALRRLERDKTQKRPTTIVPFSQVSKLVEAPSAYTKEGVRDRAILALLFYAALRRSEIMNLLVCHLIFEDDGLVIRLQQTKAQNDELQRVPKAAIPYIKALFDQRRFETASKNVPLVTEYFTLFREPTDRQLCDKGLYRIFMGWCEHVGLGTEITPHSARATAITYLCEQGVPHRSIAAFSRHTSIQMVEKYDKLRTKSGGAAITAIDSLASHKKEVASKHDLD